MNDLLIKNKIKIEDMIYEVRGKQVMFTFDVAKLYQVETKVLNQTIKRNINRFPESFCFQLTGEEVSNLPSRSQIVTLNKSDNYRGYNTKYPPYALTEQGIMMLSGLLKSAIAVEVNVQIIEAFVKMRKLLNNNLSIFNELEEIKFLTIKNTNDIRYLQESFNKLESVEKNNYIFFEGQVYDSYSKITKILEKAKTEIIIVDGYADKTVLDIISKIKTKVILICKKNSLLSKIDVEKYNKQYNNLKIVYDNSYHDRYFLLDKKNMYHCGASINYAGSKTFSINKIEDRNIINQFNNDIESIVNAQIP